MLWGLFFLLRVRPVSALGCPCHRDQQLPPHPVNYTWLVPQSHQTPGISFSWKPRLPRQLLSARHRGLRPSPAPLLLALWLKSPLTEMNSKAALISPAGSPLRTRGAEGGRCDIPLGAAVENVCLRPPGACTLGSPTEQLAECPTPEECQSQCLPESPAFQWPRHIPLSGCCQCVKHSGFLCQSAVPLPASRKHPCDKHLGQNW